MTSSGWALPDGGPLLAGDGEYGGLSPEDIRSAYDIPALGGAGRTVAVISLGSYSAVESELAIYREAYGLSVCDKANGCLAIVNEKGEESPLPGQAAFGAYIEQGLDVEMVSAVCPECHILIVDAKEGKKNTDMKAIAAANEEAAKLNATVISNSLSFPETNKEECGETGCTQYNSDFTHFVQPTVANAGDAGYENGGAGDSYPAAVPEWWPWVAQFCTEQKMREAGPRKCGKAPAADVVNLRRSLCGRLIRGVPCERRTTLPRSLTACPVI